MHIPDRATFKKLARTATLVPVYRELIVDGLTPVNAYERLAGEGPAFILESMEGSELIGRYSFVGTSPTMLFRSRGREIEILRKDGKDERFTTDGDPLEELKWVMQRFRPAEVPGLPRFCGGAVGYIGYDCVKLFEPSIEDRLQDDLGLPDAVFLITDLLVVFDHVSHRMKVLANAHVPDPAMADTAYDAALTRIDGILDRLSQPAAPTLMELPEGATIPVDRAVNSTMTKAEFTAAVERAKEYIQAGDIIQVVLSQRFETDYTGTPFQLYRALRAVNPSPYMFLLETGDFTLVGASPEIHVRCEDGRVEVRPIAGTRPRGASELEDNQLEAELLADPKERAEHIMLVDLGRNDIGRVCNFGSVQVPELMVIERYSHVMHIVSDVLGELHPDFDAFDVMRVTFPAGTVSGAPKIRAMQIIEELEKTRRGAYAGAIGYFSFSGNLDCCIGIRTAVLHGGKAYVQAGAGLVQDSIPEMEYEETRNKARGLLQAISLAERLGAACPGGAVKGKAAEEGARQGRGQR